MNFVFGKLSHQKVGSLGVHAGRIIIDKLSMDEIKVYLKLTINQMNAINVVLLQMVDNDNRELIRAHPQKTKFFNALERIHKDTENFYTDTSILMNKLLKKRSKGILNSGVSLNPKTKGKRVNIEWDDNY